MVEVLHFIGGEIIPRRVLCPWRAHLLASTLPAVARATAACFVWCEWMIGRGLGLLGKKAILQLLPQWPGGLSERKRFSGGWLRRFEPGSTRRFTERVG